MVKQPLAALDEETLRIGREDWEKMMRPLTET